MKEKRDLESVVSDVVGLLEEARRASARFVNAILTKTYWAIGRRIVEEEQQGGQRAEYYGRAVVEALAAGLTGRFGRGFGRASLFRMRAFFLAYRAREIVATASRQSPRQGRSPSKSSGSKIVQTASGQSSTPEFPLSWSHYVLLMTLEDAEARTFYESGALRGGWSAPAPETQSCRPRDRPASKRRSRIPTCSSSSVSRTSIRRATWRRPSSDTSSPSSSSSAETSRSSLVSEIVGSGMSGIASISCCFTGVCVASS